MLRTIFLLLLSLCVIPSGKAAPADDLSKQKDAPSASPWIVKTYRFSDASNFQPKDQDPFGQPRELVEPPMAPAPQAPEKEVNEFIRKSDLVLQKYFTEMGYSPPPGSLFVFDPKSFTLVARTTASFHVLIQAIVDHYSIRRAKLLGCSLEILETDAPIIRNELKILATTTDHSPSFERLSALADQGKAKRITALTGHTLSGSIAKLSRTTSHPFSTGFTMQQNGNAVTEMDRYDYGTTLELDPILSEDRTTIDLNFAFQHDFAPPTDRWTLAPSKIAHRSVESQVTDLHNVKLNSARTFQSGQTQLLGIWKPETLGNGAAPPDVLQAAFLRIDVLREGPAANALLQPWLTTLGEKMFPTPAEAPPEPADVPKGMTVEFFKIAPEFFGPPQSGVNIADQLATSMKSSSKAMETLGALGVGFPEGATATYDPAIQIMTVRNTPEILRYVGFVLEPLICRTGSLSLTSHIVQADGAFLRKLQQETRGISDHSNAWQSVEEAASKQQATILRSAWMGTRSGQRSRAEFGHEIEDVSTNLSKKTTESSNDSKPTAAPNPDLQPPTDATKQPQPQPASTSVANASVESTAERDIEGSHESERVGTMFDLDPVIDEDGRNIVLPLSWTYDYARPTMLPAAAPLQHKTVRAEVNGYEFHRMTGDQATNIASGTWQMISVWKPEGTAEFDGKDILHALFIRADIVEIEAKD